MTHYLTFAKQPASIIVYLVVLIFSANISFSQQNYKIGSRPVMELSGTSTLHDWTMTARSFTGTAAISLTPDNQLSSISALTLTVPVRNLKSDHSTMDDNSYEALKADSYKNIVFTLMSAKITSIGKNKYQISASGNLMIAGKTQPVTLETNGVVNADGSLSCNGSVSLKMTDYDVKPPTFFLGTMKVGDAVTLSFKLIFIQ